MAEWRIVDTKMRNLERIQRAGISDEELWGPLMKKETNPSQPVSIP